MLTFNNKILTRNGYWLNANPYDCPAKTLIIQFADESFTPYPSGSQWNNLGTWTQISASPNVWSLYVDSSIWGYLFDSQNSQDGSYWGYKHFSILKANLTGVTSVYNMFHANQLLDYCAPLDLSGVTSAVGTPVDFNHMFCGCTSLQNLPLLTLPSTSVSTNYMFSGCVNAVNVRSTYEALSAAANIANHTETFAYAGSYSASPYDYAIPDSWGGASNIVTRPDSYVLRLDQIEGDLVMMNMRVNHVHMTADGDYLPVTGGVYKRSGSDTSVALTDTDLQDIVYWNTGLSNYYSAYFYGATGYLEINLDLPYPPHDISWTAMDSYTGSWTTLRETLYGVYSGTRTQLAQTTFTRGSGTYTLTVTDP